MFKFLSSLLLLSILLNAKSIDVRESYLNSYNYEQMGKYSEAIKVLAPLYKKYPKGYTLNLRFGWLFYLDKKYNNAIEYYKKASLINPYSLEPKLGLIRIYLSTQSFQKAETLSYEILKVDYYNYYANIYAIKSLIAQKKYNIATTITNKMLTIYPTDIKFLELLAIIYKQTKNKYLHKLYEDILTLDPNNVLARSNIKK